MAFNASSSGETDDAFTITWLEAPEGTTDTQVAGGGFSTRIESSDSASITISGLLAETAYSVTVTALSSVGAVLGSDTVTATTLEAEVAVVVPPSDFAIVCSASTSASLTLSWSNIPAGTTQVNFAIDGVGNRNAGWATSPIVYDGLDANTSYTITGEARNTAGTVLGTSAAIVCSTALGFDIATSVSENLVTISWPAIAGATSYTYTITLSEDDSLVTSGTTGSTSVSVAIAGTDADYTVLVEAKNGTTVLVSNAGSFTTWAAESETMALTTPVLTLGTWTAGPTQLSLLVTGTTDTSIAARLADPALAGIVEYRVFLITNSLPPDPVPAEPIYEANPAPVEPDVGLYFGSVMPGAFPVTLHLAGLESGTYYGVLVNGLNASGDVIAVGAVGGTTI